MLIAIEGVDASGKATQAGLLFERLRAEGHNVRLVNFPDYASRAAGAIKMYLDGEFGTDPDDVNPFAASTFFAIDRYASYKTGWGAFLDSGGIVVADRYTMSNMIHQGAKFEDPDERNAYIEWLCDLEFIKFGLPEPALVIFLDLSMETRLRLMDKRGENAAGADAGSDTDAIDAAYDGGAKDIHESDIEYLSRANECAREIAERLSWKRISAERDGQMRKQSDIHKDIYSEVHKLLVGIGQA